MASSRLLGAPSVAAFVPWVALLVAGKASLAAVAALAAPSIPVSVLLASATCWSFALAAYCLLPVDLAAGGADQPTLVGFWRALYWITLLIGVLGAEALAKLLVAGEFTRAGRVRAALRASTRLFVVALVLAVGGALYLLASGYGAVLSSVAPLLVNGYGLLLLALLQGRGLVSVPRRVWRSAPSRAALASRYFALAAADDAHEAAAGRLRSVLQRVAAADAAAPPPPSRAPRERACWEALLGTARRAASDCRLAETQVQYLPCNSAPSPLHLRSSSPASLRSVPPLRAPQGSGLSWSLSGSLSAAWTSATEGRPRDEAALARLRRRVRLQGGAARRACVPPLGAQPTRRGCISEIIDPRPEESGRCSLPTGTTAVVSRCSTRPSCASG